MKILIIKSIIIIILFYSLFILKFASLHSNKPKIIATMFAGRKEYIEISFNYIKNLMLQEKLNEMHFWLFTDNDEDREYLKQIGNIHKTSKYFSDYQEIFPQIINNEVEISLKGEGNGFIEINNIIEILIDAESEETKHYFSLKFPNKIIIFVEHIINNKNYTSISIKIEQNGNLIIKKGKTLIRTINTKEKSFDSIKVHSGYNKEIFWDYKERKNQGIKLYDTRCRKTFDWYEMYEFYLTYEYDILLKMDDDVLFLDLNRYEDFIKYIRNNPGKNFIFPNIINQCVSMFYNNKYGIIPDDILLDFKNKKHPNDVYNCFKNAKLANVMHNYFFNNFQKFVNNLNKPISLDGLSVNICFFGVIKKNFVKSFIAIVVENTPGYNTNNFIGDETYIYSLRGNVLFSRFVVSHYAFGPQRKIGVDKSFIIRYKELSLKINKLTKESKN